MTTDIRFPQGPMVDDRGYVTDEWRQWFQNPDVVSFNFATALSVASGGTGLTSGTSGGVLAFTDATTLASSGTLTHFGPVLGGGAGAVPASMAAGTDGQLVVARTALAPLWRTMSGDATLASTGALTVAANAITNAKLAQMATLTLKGNNTGGAADPLDLTVAQVISMLGVATSATGTFTPTRTGWTDVGSPTVTASYAQVASLNFFQIKVVPSTTVATTAGTSYVTLPFTAAGITGNAAMTNLTTNIAIGECSIDVPNSRCYVPTQVATGNTLAIGGWFTT